MKRLIALVIILLGALAAEAQWYTTTNTTGTVLYGITNVTVVGSGSASSYPLWCGTSPYWIGSGAPSFPGPALPGRYNYTFSRPVNSIRVIATAMNIGETIEIKINGSPYTITSITPFAGPCLGGTSVSIIGGHMECTADAPSGSGGIVNITYCGITSAEVATSGYGNGTVYTFMFTDSGTCVAATNNGPICVNDTLKLGSPGDSLGATYLWYGPGGFTATTQNTTRTGMTMADTGYYYVVKIRGTTRDTARTHVDLKPLPVITLTTNAPICSGNTLTMRITPDSVGETYMWTGPVGFTSTIPNPTRPLAQVRYSGSYKVVANLRGCIDSGYLDITIDSTPVRPTIGSNSPLCSGRGDVLLTSSDATAGVTYRWDGPGGYTSTDQNPVLPGAPTTVSGVYTVTAILGPCSNRNTTVVVVNATPILPVLGSNAPICSGNTLNLTASSSIGSVYSWIGPNSFTSGLQNPSISPVTTLATGTYSVSATLFYPGIPGGCISDTASIFVRVDSTPETPVASTNSPGAPSLCEGDTLKFFALSGTAGVSYLWSGPTLFTTTVQNPIIYPVTTAATGNYTVTVTYGACSSFAIVTATITPMPVITATSNSPVCTGMKDTLFLQANGAPPGTTYTWTGPYTFRSGAQNPFRTPVIMEYAGVYFVTAHLGQCNSVTVSDTVVVHETPPTPWINWLTYCQYYDAPPLMASGQNIRWYNTIGGPGSITPPVPATTTVGRKFYYVTQTVQGCTSPVDSILITVYPKPVIKAITPDTSVCPHDSAILSVVNIDPIAYYKWVPGLYLSDSTKASVVTKPITNIKYTLVTSNQFGCSDTSFVGVTVYPSAVVQVADSVTIYPGEAYQLNTQTNCSTFEWFPPSGLSDKFSSNPIATPELSTRYFVTATTSWGCKAMDSIDVNVSLESLVSAPNAFVPGSGINGKFYVIKRGLVTLKSFAIYDRWGVKVFETSNAEDGWDGSYKGTPQPQGVYIYQVEGATSIGTTFKKQGNVTLIR